MPTLLVNRQKSIEFISPMPLSRLLAEQGIRTPMPCGGAGKCGKCAAVIKGDLSPVSDTERATLGDGKIASGYRLICKAVLLGDAEIALAEKENMVAVSRGVFYRKNVDGEDGLGIAVDIGTTTVAAYLYSLNDGTLLCEHAAANPQRSFGADVISRMQHSLDGKAEQLAAAIRGCLSELTLSLLTAAGADSADVKRMVIAGNTAMMYFLCCLPVNSIAFAPFNQDEFFGKCFTAKELQLPLDDNLPVYLVRSIGAYVGGDITAAILSCLLYERRGTHLLIDIGTNGEMALVSDGKISSCSTAAGPALEGAGISHGMSAEQGAVSEVKFKNGEFSYKTIADAEPKGFCGTGVLDMAAALLDSGICDQTGRLLAEGHGHEQHMTEVDSLPAFRLPGTDILFTSADMRAVQMAKAAIRAGLDTLVLNAGKTYDDIQTLFIAGGFGSYIDINSAARIGLIPESLAAKSVVLGNASGTGAAMMLLCEGEKTVSENVAKAARCFDLASDIGFISAYTDAMFFT